MQRDPWLTPAAWKGEHGSHALEIQCHAARTGNRMHLNISWTRADQA